MVLLQPCLPMDRFVAWGDAAFGGDSRAVEHQLKAVQQVQASAAAFAAVLDDGSVVTWGDAKFGGDSSAVQDHLHNVQQVQAVTSLLLPFLAMVRL